MSIEEIKVPEGIEYISQWEGFELPKGHSIIDKTICGCGFTEFCLTNQKEANIIVIPRRALGDNKMEQHKDDHWIYYFKNEKSEELENYDTDITEKEFLDIIPKEERQSYIAGLKVMLYDWIKITIQSNINRPKILVTYDSLHYVLDIVNQFPIDFHIVVDEFQSIFLDASFKAEVEIGFIEDLKLCKDVTYLSATPMLEEYLKNLDYFKDLPFYKFNWGMDRIENIRIERRNVSSIPQGLKDILSDYKVGNFPKKILSDGKVVQSRELVVFVNSIKSITDIISKNGLIPDEVNILCAKTPVNVRKLKKIGFEVGHIPLRGEEHKMFTFCTRTTYLGADFYSTSAYSVVCSDCSIKSLALDISLDLPQIIGRQRLKENAFRNEVLFLYKAAGSRNSILNLSKEEYDNYLIQLDLETQKLLKGYQEMSEDTRKSWARKASESKELYTNDFLSISKRTGEPVYNYLVKISKQRAYDVTRKDYQDMVTIKKGIESISSINAQVVDERVFDECNKAADELVKIFESTNNFNERMRAFCKYMQEYPTLVSFSFLNAFIPVKYFNYFNLLGPGLIGTLMYVEKNIKDAFDKKLNEGNTNIADSGIFIIGEKYTSSEIKERLKRYYDENNIVKAAKATDLNLYYETKPCLIMDSKTGKRDHGFIIVKRKEE